MLLFNTFVVVINFIGLKLQVSSLDSFVTKTSEGVAYMLNIKKLAIALLSACCVVTGLAHSNEQDRVQT